MCLLKRSDRDTNCGHEDCKNFYMLNNQMCMYNINTNIPVVNPQNNALTSIQSQFQLGSLLSQKSNTPTVNIASSLNIKRPNNIPLENTIGEQETVFLNKKKIKPEEQSRNEDNNQSISRNDATNGLTDLNLLSQQILTQNTLERNNQQANFINAITTNNGQICIAKPDGAGGYTLGNNTIFIPVMQAPQGNVNLSTAGYTSVIATPQNTFNNTNGAQILSQNIRMKSQSTNSTFNGITVGSDQVNKSNNSSNMNSASSNGTISSSPNSSNAANQAIENFMKEFQAKTSGLLMSQNKMLLELKEKNEIIQDTLACLINEMSALKNIIKQNSNEKTQTINAHPLLMNHMNMNSNEAATTDTLLNLIYGQNQSFNYQLTIKSNLTLPLYRERNFKFTLFLTDKDGNLVSNTNRIPLTIAIYSSESVPKFIDANTSGNKILKGFIEKDLVNGTVTFEKIQIKEVTSHFRNGWIFFVVYPKLSSNNSNVLNSGKGTIINNHHIRPFVLEKVVVKAKKAKEKELENEEEEEEGETKVFEEDSSKKVDEEDGEDE